MIKVGFFLSNWHRRTIYFEKSYKRYNMHFTNPFYKKLNIKGWHNPNGSFRSVYRCSTLKKWEEYYPIMAADKRFELEYKTFDDLNAALVLEAL